jgi:hypothetical protein
MLLHWGLRKTTLKTKTKRGENKAREEESTGKNLPLTDIDVSM